MNNAIEVSPTTANLAAATERDAFLVDSDQMVSTLQAELTEREDPGTTAGRLESIAEFAVDAVVGADLDGVITDWNHAAQSLYGYSAEEALGRPISMLAPTGRVASDRQLLDRVARGEFVANADTMRRRKDGSAMEVMLSISPIRGADGAVIGVVAITRDVTAGRHDDRTIAALHAVAYAAGNILDAERLVALTRAQARDAFGVDALVVYWWEEVSEVLHPIGRSRGADLNPLGDAKQRSGQGLAGVAFETRLPLIVEDYGAWPEAHARFGGGVGSAMAVPMSVGGHVVGVIAALSIERRSFTDHDLELLTRFASEVTPGIVVAQLRAEAHARRAQLAASEARASGYFQSNPVPGLITRRRDNVILDVNEAFIQLLDFPREALIGRTALDVGLYALPSERNVLYDEVDRAGEARAELSLRTRAGETRSVLTYVERSDIAGEPCAIVGCVDLTEQKWAAALEQRQQVIEEATRAKSAFLANMSHELRTPLNAILGFSELLLEQLDIGDKHRGFLNNVHEAGRHLLELINEVLDISRVEAGRLELHRESITLASLLEPVVAATRLAAESRNLDFEVTTIADPTVTVDPTRVRQILNNLLSNAVKFTPAGGNVRLAVTVGKDVLIFEVKDSGIGIPRESHGRVFGTFERFHERVDGVPGTGLGLALTKVLVELHGGTVTFESGEGVGSTFIVRLPGSIPRPASGAELLVVEDDRRDADLIVALAERRGLTTDVVTTVAEALAAIERRVPAGIVLDLDLPDGRGETVLRALRDRDQHIPAVIVTALEDEPDQDLGADDHLTKPIETDRLDHWLERVAVQVAVCRS